MVSIKTIGLFRWNFETVNGAGNYRVGEQAYLSVSLANNQSLRYKTRPFIFK